MSTLESIEIDLINEFSKEKLIKKGTPSVYEYSKNNNP